MSKQIEDIISVAKRYVGIKENPPNSNNVIFNIRYYGKPVSGPNYAWCCTTMWCLFQDIGAPELFYGGGKCAGCTTLMNFAKSKGQFYTSGFKPGDLALFDFDKNPTKSEHVGIITEVFPKYVKTIEGNTGVGNDANGGAVMERERDLSLIIGVYRPKYEEEKEMTDAEFSKKFNENMEKYLKARALLPVSSGLKTEFEAAKSAGITDGSRPKDFATREETAVMVNRAKNK